MLPWVHVLMATLAVRSLVVLTGCITVVTGIADLRDLIRTAVDRHRESAADGRD